MGESGSRRVEHRGVSRRTALAAAAWSSPLIAVTIAAPIAAAATEPRGTMVIVGMPYTPPGGTEAEFTNFLLTALHADGDPVVDLDVSTGEEIAGQWQWMDNGPQTNLNGQWNFALPLSIEWTRFAMRAVIDGVLVTSNIVDRRAIVLTSQPSTTISGYDEFIGTATSSPGVPAAGVEITTWLLSGGVWSPFDNSGTTLANGEWSGLYPTGGSWTQAYISGTVDGVTVESNRVAPSA